MLHVLIVDDEAPARSRLHKLLQPLVAAGRIDVVGIVEDGPSALQVITEQDVDLLFLDIRMPEMDGFGVLERIPPNKHPVVVFTTAHDDYSLRAFEANAVDYLLKPIVRARLEDAVARAERLRQTPESWRENDDRLDKLLDWMERQARGPVVEKPPRYMERISVPYRDRILLINVDRLVSAEIIDSITRLFILTDDTADQRTRLRQHVVGYTLEQLEANLDPSKFMRIHRSSIVQLASIREMIPWFSGRYKLLLAGKREVIASRERSRALKERLMM